ncbi:MAG: hypothetical protein ABIJ28_04205 [Patescibacteria group bacterium]
MEKLDPVQKYVSKLIETIRKNNIVMPGRSGWISAIIFRGRDEYRIREGVKKLQEILKSKNIKIPPPPKKVKEFLDFKREYPTK